MSKRSSRKFEADPHQFYREPRFTAEQAFDSLEFAPPGATRGESVIWDPACGAGNILNVAAGRNYRTFGSDIVDRPARARSHPFERTDFLKLREFPFRSSLDEPVSLLCNPPYGRVGGVANMGERFVYHALEHFGERCHRLAFIMPIEFQCGVDRYWNLYRHRRPSHVLICCQRPSMLPGELVEQGRKASGGMADYCVLVWSAGGPYRTEAIFMRPDDSTRPPEAERRVR
jgi:hypothetical protein